MEITPQKEEYRVGDIPTCHADAFSLPFFTWKNMRTTEQFADVHIILPQS